MLNKDKTFILYFHFFSAGVVLQNTSSALRRYGGKAFCSLAIITLTEEELNDFMPKVLLNEKPKPLQDPLFFYPGPNPSKVRILKSFGFLTNIFYLL